MKVNESPHRSTAAAEAQTQPLLALPQINNHT